MTACLLDLNAPLRPRGVVFATPSKNLHGGTDRGFSIKYRRPRRVSLILSVFICANLPLASQAANGFSKQAFESKLDYCETCHGNSGQGFRGYVTMPRLAGQQPQYIENQLRAFIEHRRKNPVMANVAHAIDPKMVPALAAHFHMLNPPPFGGAPKNSAALGKKILEDGLPEDNVPACFACHGLKAEGGGQIPRLAGQLYWYIIKVLSNWSTERGQGASDISAIMLPTTHNLTYAQVEALAAYLSSLR